MASLLTTKRAGVEANTFQVSVCYERRRYKLPGWKTDSMGRALSEELGRNVTRLLQCKASGAIPPDLRRYVETLPPRVRRSMAKQGIIEGATEGKAVAEHITDFKLALTHKGNTADYVDETARTLVDVLGACGCKMLGDVTGAKVRTELAERRKDKAKLDAKGKPALDADGKPILRRGISARRHNAMLTALGGFFRWCIRERRAYENPVSGVSKLNERTDKRHERRALEPAEVRALMSAATAGAEMYGMSGAERTMLYRVAVETGLRFNELRTLTRGCIDLKALTVTVRASYSKRRQEDVLPIRAELAKALQEHIANKAPAALVFNTGREQDTLRAFRADCEAAAIARVDPSGRVVDFHALRHTFITSLAAAGVHPKTAQMLARHSTITLTMDRYTHTLRGAEAAALASLPDYATPEAASAKKTGTDDVPVDPAGKLPKSPANASGPFLKISGNDAAGGEVEKLGGKSGGARGVNQCPNGTAVDNDSEGDGITEKPVKTGENRGFQGAKGERPEPDSNRRQTDLQSVSGDLQGANLQPLTTDASERRGKCGGAAGLKTIDSKLCADPTFAVLADAWPTLPAAIKAGIVAMVKAASGGGPS